MMNQKMKPKIEIYYGLFRPYPTIRQYFIFERCSFDFNSPLRMPRFNERAKEGMRKLKTLLPERFIQYMLWLSMYWWQIDAKQLLEYIPFTLGIDTNTGVKALAVTHPKDNFARKIGRKIVKGRIKKQLTEGYKKEYFDKRWIYDPLLEGVEQEKVKYNPDWKRFISIKVKPR